MAASDWKVDEIRVGITVSNGSTGERIQLNHHGTPESGFRDLQPVKNVEDALAALDTMGRRLTAAVETKVKRSR